MSTAYLNDLNLILENLKYELAIANIDIFIERKAYAALCEIKAHSVNLQGAIELIHRAELRKIKLESEVASRLHLKKIGICPFDSELWKGTCVERIRSFQNVESIFSHRFDIWSWARRQIEFMNQSDTNSGYAIIQMVLSEALGAQPLNYQCFNDACRAASSEAASCCGQSDFMWSMRVTDEIGYLLSLVGSDDEIDAKKIATMHGWLTRHKIDELTKMINDSGLCDHGIDPYNCPVGCGDLE